tara:strand:- start:157 stop:273 length:117 start_codon:yes stop_codon:yes gene_type:complete
MSLLAAPVSLGSRPPLPELDFILPGMPMIGGYNARYDS